MITTSSEYKSVVTGERTWYMTATIVLSDTTELTIENDNIVQGGFSIDDATSEENNFTIGATIMNTMKFVLDNKDGTYDDINFKSAVIYPHIGLQLSASIEYLDKGVFTVASVKRIGATIQLIAYDNMYKLNKKWVSQITFPTTVVQLLTSVCLWRGVTIGIGANFTNASIVIPNKPKGKKTCRQIVAYIAQIAGAYCKINNEGELILGWYDFDTLTSTIPPTIDLTKCHYVEDIFESDISQSDFSITGIGVEKYGEVIDVYTPPTIDEDSYKILIRTSFEKILFGGDYYWDNAYQNPRPLDTNIICQADLTYYIEFNTDYIDNCTNDLIHICNSVGSAYITFNLINYTLVSGNLYKVYGSSISGSGGIELTQIVGVRFDNTYAILNNIKIYSENDIIQHDIVVDENNILIGDSDYLLQVQDNPLIQTMDNTYIIAVNLSNKLIGNTFRPMQLSALSDPRMESGDIAIVKDWKGNYYKTAFNQVNYKINIPCEMICSVDLENENAITSPTYVGSTQVEMLQNVADTWLMIPESAYKSAQDGGYTGTNAEFETDLASIQGLADAISAIVG